MSAKASTMEETVFGVTNPIYRSKQGSDSGLFNGITKHGSVGWAREEVSGVWIELRFWEKNPFNTGWVTLAEYQKRAAEIKMKNIEFFRHNPHLLREKIQQKDGSPRLIRPHRPCGHGDFCGRGGCYLP